MVRFLALAGMRLAAMPPRVLIASTMLPGEPPRDPVDRIIAATGRAFGYTIITRDGDLMLYAKAGHIEAIGCRSLTNRRWRLPTRPREADRRQAAVLSRPLAWRPPRQCGPRVAPQQTLRLDQVIDHRGRPELLPARRDLFSKASRHR
jgi:hypothetical protein